MDRPTIENTNAVFQAGTTIGMYLGQAIDEIDKRLGEGYAEKHPALLAECIRSQTMDFNSTALIAVLYEIRDALETRHDAERSGSPTGAGRRLKMLKRLWNLLRGRTLQSAAPVRVQPVVGRGVEHVWCRFAGPGRGDCAHFIGLPGKSIPGQHDGSDDTVDAYGIPNGWCEYCWLEHRYTELQKQLNAATPNARTERPALPTL